MVFWYIPAVGDSVVDSHVATSRHLCPGGDLVADVGSACGAVIGAKRCACGAPLQLVISGCRTKSCPVCQPVWVW